MLSHEKIFKILRDQNIWFKEFNEEYITRENLLNPEFIESNSVSIIKGARRTGKTTLLKQIIDCLLSQGVNKDQILYVNLEDYGFAENLSLELLEKILEVYRTNINADKKTFFFLDEIQNVKGFERFMRTVHDKEKKSIKFFLTGSNAKLLSQEIGTLLTGRTSSITVYPFSFKEYLQYKGIEIKSNKYFELEEKENSFKKHLRDYIKHGGIPEFFGEKHPEKRLREYFENIIYRDIVERFEIRNSKTLKEIAIYLATNSTKPFSINKLKNIYGISINTVREYISHLELAFLFFYVSSFSHSLKQVNTSQAKVFPLDSGLVHAVTFSSSEDRGRFLEHIVFLELKRRAYEVFYHKDKKECDFIIREKNKITQIIQVAENLDKAETYKREIDGLLEAHQNYKSGECLILNFDKYEDKTIENVKVKFRPVWYWLLT